jgi:hypothetical protein
VARETFFLARDDVSFVPCINLMIVVDGPQPELSD